LDKTRERHVLATSRLAFGCLVPSGVWLELKVA